MCVPEFPASFRRFPDVCDNECASLEVGSEKWEVGSLQPPTTNHQLPNCAVLATKRGFARETISIVQDTSFENDVSGDRNRVREQPKPSLCARRFLHNQASGFRSFRFHFRSFRIHNGMICGPRPCFTRLDTIPDRMSNHRAQVSTCPRRYFRSSKDWKLEVRSGRLEAIPIPNLQPPTSILWKR